MGGMDSWASAAGPHGGMGGMGSRASAAGPGRSATDKAFESLPKHEVRANMA